MKQALLFWDKYNIIAPWPDFKPDLESEIAEAWSIVGGTMVPDRSQKSQAHDDIVSFIENKGHLNDKFFFNKEWRGGARDIYEVYPQKLLGETWRKLEDEGFAGELLPDFDRPMSHWGGLVIMAKLADACAGDTYLPE